MLQVVDTYAVSKIKEIEEGIFRLKIDKEWMKEAAKCCINGDDDLSIMGETYLLEGWKILDDTYGVLEVELEVFRL